MTFVSLRKGCKWYILYTKICKCLGIKSYNLLNVKYFAIIYGVVNSFYFSFTKSFQECIISLLKKNTAYNICCCCTYRKKRMNYRDRILKWNGWGYADSSFVVRDYSNVVLTGNRLVSLLFPFLLVTIDRFLFS